MGFTQAILKSSGKRVFDVIVSTLLSIFSDSCYGIDPLWLFILSQVFSGADHLSTDTCGIEW